jgi:hypothetical protein
MQSKATTVDQYLASLPPDRRAAIETVRKVVLANLDKTGFEEGMTYGMIGYYVPHRVYPAGYHCDPKQPLPFANLASQKNHMALYMMGLYVGGGPNGASSPIATWFQEAWKKTGKKLDMGKACIRFKKTDDLALDVIGEAVRRMTAAKYIETYEKALATPRSTKPGETKATTKSGKAKPAASSVTKPAATKATTTSRGTKPGANKPTTARQSAAKHAAAKPSAGSAATAKAKPSRAK